MKNMGKNNSNSKEIASRVQNPVPKVIRPRGRVAHGLFFDPRNHYIDGRTRIARIIRDVTKHLLEHFPEPIPAGALLVARQCAYKALRLRAFEHAVLTGEGEPAKTTDDAYLALSNSLTKDVELLHRLSKESGTPEKVPSLAEYLEAIKAGTLIAVEEKEDEADS
jgi:hypothetical protein